MSNWIKKAAKEIDEVNGSGADCHEINISEEEIAAIILSHAPVIDAEKLVKAELLAANLEAQTIAYNGGVHFTSSLDQKGALSKIFKKLFEAYTKHKEEYSDARYR